MKINAYEAQRLRLAQHIVAAWERLNPQVKLAGLVGLLTVAIPALVGLVGRWL